MTENAPFDCRQQERVEAQSSFHQPYASVHTYVHSLRYTVAREPSQPSSPRKKECKLQPGSGTDTADRSFFSLRRSNARDGSSSPVSFARGRRTLSRGETIIRYPRFASEPSRLGLDELFSRRRPNRVRHICRILFGRSALGKGTIGVALAVGGIAGVVSQIPGGALADAVRSKRALVAIGILMIGAAALLLALLPDVIAVFLAELLHGATAGH